MGTPQINATVGAVPALSMDEAKAVRAYYGWGLPL